MAVEKKKVNLVNLKTKFGLFLYNHYCCQNCFSIDKFTIGFTCEHKYCLQCNDNLANQCKECKNEVENRVDDRIQQLLFPYFEDLKGIMSVDLNKVASKLRQVNGQNAVPKAKSVEKEQIDVEMKENDDQCKDKNEEQKTEDLESPTKEKASVEEPMEEENNKAEEDIVKPSENRSSRRQNTKKANESKKKNLSAKQNKANVEEKAEEKSVSKSRESSRSKKSLNDYIKETVEEDEKESEPKEAEKVTKSIRKADKSNKSTKKSLVIISTSITENEVKILNKFAKKFNAKIVNDYSEEITHLVTLETKPNSRLTTRTLKYLKSLLAHKWLLDFKWIKESLEQNQLVDESDYELIGITKQTDDNLGAPKRSRESQNTNLFEGKQFYIDGKFGPKSGLPKNDYKELVKVGGGELIESDKNIQDDTYIIIEANSVSKSKYKGMKKTLTTTDFLNCVSDFKFDL